MKKIVLSVLFIFISICGFSQSNVFKINIFSPLVRTLNVSFEHAFTTSSSVQLGFFYTGVSVADLKYRGIGITPEYRFFLSETAAPDGVYVAPYLRYQNINLEEETSLSEASFTGFGGGLVIGREWIFKELISLEAFIGPGYIVGSVDVKSGNEEDFDVGAGFDGFTVRAGVNIGIAF